MKKAKKLGNNNKHTDSQQNYRIGTVSNKLFVGVKFELTAPKSLSC